jgi:hypothetical protein
MGLGRFNVLGFASRRLAWTFVICAAVLLSACGGDDDKEPTPTKDAGTVAAPTSAGGGASTTKTPGTEPTFDATASNATQAAMNTTVAGFKGDIDACKLVSRNDAEKIIGKKLGNDPFHGAFGFENVQSVCNYNPESVPGTAIVDDQTITLAALTSDDLKTFGIEDDVKTSFKDGMESSKEDEGFQEVDGLGDEAYYTTGAGLNVRKGDTGLTVTNLPLDKAKEFMKKALDNL